MSNTVILLLKRYYQYSKDDGIVEANGSIKRPNQQPRRRAARLLPLCILTNTGNDAFLLAEGKSLGLAEGKLETARNLRTMGLSIENIAKATGLTVQEVEQL